MRYGLNIYILFRWISGFKENKVNTFLYNAPRLLKELCFFVRFSGCRAACRPTIEQRTFPVK